MFFAALNFLLFTKPPFHQPYIVLKALDNKRVIRLSSIELNKKN